MKKPFSSRKFLLAFSVITGSLFLDALAFVLVLVGRMEAALWLDLSKLWLGGIGTFLTGFFVGNAHESHQPKKEEVT